MSIATEITRLQTAKADLKTAIEGKGVTVPSATKIDGYADLVDAIPQGSTPTGTKQISVTSNGTQTENVSGYASAQLNVAVPNSYSQSDEGKVVSNGALVAQTAHADVTPATSDQTIDTTTNNSIKFKGDADLVASNIKKDVEIFGVTGSYEGGGGTDYLAERLNNTLLEYYSEDVTKTSDYNFYGDGANKLKTLHLPNCGVIGSNLFLWNSGIEIARFPKAYSLGGNGAFSHASKLSVVDIGQVGWINNLTFEACTALTTIIIRKTNGIAGLGHTNVFNSSRFANGGAGGTIYLPEVIYNHLGDGTNLDYQSASNWATIYGYGTITWAKLEGSAYESEDWSA